ncbi:hypothetical protein CI109_104291 [Kwoniella shandongensis]|uniref:Uncharacterized protein n=1 Tax=Kwoniella shandongensis TaxID=1734106 RepID=A0A5M6C646_9TREE|nr:uncharacterized protein CI109_002804 [Kwoniella shandongensis]KAA5528649.1 hypothetical protein CI109_002804 [Kwoniella shandongensis]
MSHTPIDSHFVQHPDLDILGHRPHKLAKLFLQAITATAVFRIWPTLLFMGGWSAMIVLVNMKTKAEMTVPTTMLTVLGVVLGLTLSYRTSSAYDRYMEGRRLWSQIILANRTWARIVWIHCPDSLTATPPEDPEAKALDTTRGVLEKATLVRMGLAFAVAVKHYLRGEEGILYEDLYDLVKFIPSLDLPSGLPSAEEANIATGALPQRHVHNDTDLSSSTSSTESKVFGSPTPSDAVQTTPRLNKGRPPLHPARDPPRFRWSDTFPIHYFISRRQRLKAAHRKALQDARRSLRSGGGVGQNVPLEINMFMSSWIAALQYRKTVDASTVNALLTALLSMSEALSSLERILTTPIPWSYNAHIWEVTWIYCLVLPFQLYGAGFGWITIPAVVITSYIVIGFAEIGEEIENPFGYDRNDLNLDHFTENIIKQELAAITARPFPPPEEWVFSARNETHGRPGIGADDLIKQGLDEVRRGLAGLSSTKVHMRRARSPEDEA